MCVFYQWNKLFFIPFFLSIIYLFVTCSVILLGRLHYIPTKNSIVTIEQIIPDMTCNGGNCSTYYHMTMKDKNNHYFYFIKYFDHNLPFVGQNVIIDYIDVDFWPIKETVLSEKGVE